MKKIWVTKENGDKELFSADKVKDALRRSGVGAKESEEIFSELTTKLYDGIGTKEIYDAVYRILREMRPEVTHKYNLKRALQAMGPAGYHFEDFTSHLFSMEGYSTKVRQILEGKCVSHEIDVVAEKNKKRYVVECKFYNRAGYKCRIQTALYVYARYLDLIQGAKKGTCQEFDKPWLVTNTKFSEDVLRYADCMEIPLLGWRYPAKYGLEIMIEKHKCYPITVIQMKQETAQKLMSKGIVNVYDIPESAEKLAKLADIQIANAKKIIERRNLIG